MDAKNIATGWGTITRVAIYHIVVALGMVLKRKSAFQASGPFVSAHYVLSIIQLIIVSIYYHLRKARIE